MRGIGLGLAVASLASLAPAADLGLGIGVGAYFPTQGVVRDALGSQWTRFGISPMSFGRIGGFSVDFDLDVIAHSSRGNRVSILFPSVGFMGRLGGGGETVPYFAARAGYSYNDYRIGGVSRNDFRPGANVELGVMVNGRFNLSARYDLFQKRDGLDFSGFSINARLIAFKF